MQIVRSLEYASNNKEENLPKYEESFPHICTEARIHEWPSKSVPWHWHAALELFYMEKGDLEYTVPGGKYVFPEGSMGLVNSNVLHTTKPVNDTGETIQRLHIFDASLISGPAGSRITREYITPVITNPSLEIVGVYPKTEKERDMIRLVKQTFCLDEAKKGYELVLRNDLSQIWLYLFESLELQNLEDRSIDRSKECLKAMMLYVHEHYAEKIRVDEIAQAGFISVRECYRVFEEGLHCTPMEYLNEYRLQMACHLITTKRLTLTEIGQSCGFSSSSYFSRKFQQSIGCSPLAFRTKEKQKSENILG